ncbi:hypothetical protein P152DRAFT_345979 [Eremomyces bilateralis CBS 781.70]|uniref:Copper acquisition factor BIM1-like domain-containing protein n=1 Tax=Eremomyces bilateralis CBS 781.70 TaxID=1392243 RepID=A0A6G1G441_9PEZI|nr:uncharacterized protein P152DRAFT_345979 [Eremomyces bilateralis CBS 781.70]KAF1812676.1 hypothetical protein P152DRAFT_345979 [Eremomyces bilateralis CBS 781.70]
MHISAVLLSLPALSFAHFHLLFPPVRGSFDAGSLDQYPCGGQNTVGDRTDFPISGGPIQIDNEHTESKIQVLLALGENPTGDDFVYVMLPTIYAQGPQEFCMGMVGAPAEANVTEGTKGTISVVTSGDSNGGLYQCADVTFVNTPLPEAEYNDNCKNATGIQVSSSNGNANGSSSATSPSSSSDGGAAASPTSTPGAASVNGLGPALAVAVGAMGIAALL